VPRIRADRLISRLGRVSALGTVVRRLLPARAARRLARTLGYGVPEMIDISRVDLVREREPAWLGEASNLERELLPALGINDFVPEVFPAHLQPALGRGLRHYQYPIQFAPYLALLSGLRISSYLELGVLHGGTFIVTTEYLNRFSPLRTAVAIDLDTVPALEQYARQTAAVQFVRADSRSRRVRRLVRLGAPWDLVLVDGNHAYEACRKDVELTRPNANMLALHDIVDDASPGVRQVWRELRAAHTATFHFLEFAAQYPAVLERTGHPVMGIGLAMRKDFAAHAWRGAEDASEAFRAEVR
jgi:hypothetical protein